MVLLSCPKIYTKVSTMGRTRTELKKQLHEATSNLLTLTHLLATRNLRVSCDVCASQNCGPNTSAICAVMEALAKSGSQLAARALSAGVDVSAAGGAAAPSADRPSRHALHSTTVVCPQHTWAFRHLGLAERP